MLRDALAHARSWAGFLPGAIDTAVSLRNDTPPAGVVRVHPAGGLEVRQKVVPLAHKVTQFGGAAPVGPDEYRITRVSLNGSAVDDRDDAIDWFAPAQYEALSDADKLSRPSFEQMPAGVRVGGAPVDADAPLVAELKYETVFIDVDFPPWTRPPEPLPLFFVSTLISSSAAATASIATRGNRRFVDRAQAPALAFGEERYTVMAVDDLTAGPAVGNGEPLTATQAHQLLAEHLVGASRGPRPARGRARVGGARMTDEVAVHSFLSHLRTGVGAAPFPAGTGAHPAHARGRDRGEQRSRSHRRDRPSSSTGPPTSPVSTPTRSCAPIRPRARPTSSRTTSPRSSSTLPTFRGATRRCPPRTGGSCRG